MEGFYRQKVGGSKELKVDYFRPGHLPSLRGRQGFYQEDCLPNSGQEILNWFKIPLLERLKLQIGIKSRFRGWVEGINEGK